VVLRNNFRSGKELGFRCLHATSILHPYTYPTMSPSERSVEDDTSRIMEKIIDCGILDSSPSMSRASKTLQHTVNYAVDDGWNTEDDNEELLAAINSCGILQSSLDHRIEHKRPRGRPKKKAIKRESIDHQPLHGHERISGAGTHHKQIFATHEVESSTQTLQPNRGATIRQRDRRMSRYPNH
jgi:hypothetical protein